MPTADAGELSGAQTILSPLIEKYKQKSQPDISASDVFLNDLEGYSQNRQQLSPQQAAQQWLDLIFRYWTLTDSVQTQPSQNLFISMDQFIRMIPPPPSWAFLEKAIESRYDQQSAVKDIRILSLRLFVHYLNNNRRAQERDFDEIMANVKEMGSEAEKKFNKIFKADEIALHIKYQDNEKERILESFRRTIPQNAIDSAQPLTLDVPDLVSLMGKKSAEKMLRDLIILPNTYLNIQEGEDTLKLAQKLALELINEVKTPQWNLVRTLDAAALYEALRAKFSSSDPGMFMHYKQTADLYYLLGLIIAGRSEDAKSLALLPDDSIVLPQEVLEEIEGLGYSLQVYQFLEKVLMTNSESPLWDLSTALAVKLNRRDDMKNLIQRHINQEAGNGVRLFNLRYKMAMSYLAFDQIDQGIELLQTILHFQGDNLDAQDKKNVFHTKRDAALTLARIGKLMGDHSLIEQGLQHAKDLLKDQDPELLNESWERESFIGTLMELFIELDRKKEAADMIQEQLNLALERLEKEDTWQNRQEIYNLFKGLLSVYYSSQRYRDVIFLLDKSPFWGKKDLQEQWDEELYYQTAEALYYLGEREKAKVILYEYLNRDPTNDRVYQLLINIEGTALLPKLDELVKRDQFEERPLIWKAYLLHTEGRLNEAEQITRKAIAMDPSDGEQGRGDRMRVYKILADILFDRQQFEDAKFYQNVVEAIRISEKADEYARAGLLSQAIEIYKAALSFFQDAYCIQSRMAIQLERLGKVEEAAAYYKRAYELMPDSFGYVESHCFGCEGVFQTRQAQGIAENIFDSLTLKMPDKPQVYYLKGYLRERQHRLPEAVELYRKAVQLDPQYLNAWRKLYEIGKRMHLAQEDQEPLVLNLLRLDPLRRHHWVKIDAVRDLKALWYVLAENQKYYPQSAHSVYPLGASSAQIESAQNQPTYRTFDVKWDYSFRTPEDGIADISFVRLLENLMNQNVNTILASYDN